LKQSRLALTIAGKSSNAAFLSGVKCQSYNGQMPPKCQLSFILPHLQPQILLLSLIPTLTMDTYPHSSTFTNNQNQQTNSKLQHFLRKNVINSEKMPIIFHFTSFAASNLDFEPHSYPQNGFYSSFLNIYK
jgi:hypothetical protein